jgi:hypothetical protein
MAREFSAAAIVPHSVRRDFADTMARLHFGAGWESLGHPLEDPGDQP